LLVVVPRDGPEQFEGGTRKWDFLRPVLGRLGDGQLDEINKRVEVEVPKIACYEVLLFFKKATPFHLNILIKN